MDTELIQLIIVVLVVLGIIGAKGTWELTKKLPQYLGIGIQSIEGFVISVIIFVAVFFIISPVMGVIAIIKKLF